MLKKVTISLVLVAASVWVANQDVRATDLGCYGEDWYCQTGCACTPPQAPGQ